MSQKIDPSAAATPQKAKSVIFGAFIQNVFLKVFYFRPSEPEPEPWDPSVHLLTSSTFQSTLDRFERSIIMFYAPWCGHCKKVC